METRVQSHTTRPAEPAVSAESLDPALTCPLLCLQEQEPAGPTRLRRGSPAPSMRGMDIHQLERKDREAAEGHGTGALPLAGRRPL